MKAEITPAREADLQVIQQILNENALPFSDLTTAHLSTFLVFRTDNDIIASIGTEIYKPYALLRSLAVRPAYRNKGYAAKLAEAVENVLLTKGVTFVYLLTTGADKYFARRGYLPIDRKEVPPEISATNEFRQLCPQTAVCMVKHLYRR